MTRVLFVVFGNAGHLNPMISVAQHLATRGCTLGFVGHAGLDQRLARAGITARCFPDGGAAPSVTDSAAFGKRLVNRKWAERYLRMTWLDRIPEQIEPTREAIRAFDPDVVCIDSMAYAGAVAAARASKPWACISTNLMPIVPPGWKFDYLDFFAANHTARTALFSGSGTDATFHGCDVISPWLNIAFTVDELVPEHGARPYAFLVGAARPLHERGDEVPFPWDRLPTDRPIVYVGFGSQISHPPELVLDLVRAFRPEDGHLVISAKDVLDQLAEAPDHITAVAYTPQLALLERADMMVNHGGANSVMECLQQGRPQLVLPLANDAFIQARIVAHAGVGLELSGGGLTGELIRDNILRILAVDSPFRTEASRIRSAYAGHDGGREASDLVIQLASTRAPIAPPCATVTPTS
jgi:UDP:flavonoid glycosyltransferase YjiC (YdhE family)